ncbi:calcium-binding protein [Candidatus Nitrosocosmicus sp. FF01]|uniref:calcium-binding protein n=1 Tax=Candidatus Nitrosocosmicus sp. FF01 TaxID=3397670 RepID=UPI0039E87265
MPKSKTNKLTISLIIIVISIIFFTPNYQSQTALAQSDQVSGGGILSCDFVQFCSNPVEITRNLSDSSSLTTSEQTIETTQAAPEDETQAAPEDETQAAPEDETQAAPEDETQAAPEDETQAPGTTELIPDVTSNISLIMTPDLPESLGVDEFPSTMEPALQSANDTMQPTVEDTPASNLSVIPENITVITPSSEIPPSTLEENVTVAIDNELENNTDNVLDNATTASNIIPLENLTSPASQNLTQTIAANETIDSTAANETIDSTAANETIDSTAANETIDSTAANETIDSTAANETIDSTAANETIDSTAANETIDSTAANETIDSTAANETIDSTAANDVVTSPEEGGQEQVNVTTTNTPQSTSEQSSQNQPSPTAFLDPIINPFKELFGIK